MHNKPSKRTLIIDGTLVIVTLSLVFILGKINPVLQLFSISLAGFAIILSLSHLRPLINKALKDENLKPEAKYCPYCGAKLEDDFIFCNHCGKKLPESK